MKTFRVALACLILLPLISGCDKWKDKRFSTTIPLTLTVSKGSTDPVVINLDSTLTSLINEDLDNVKEKIKRYELVSITYKIWEFSGDPSNVLTGSVGFGNMNMNDPGVDYSFNNISLKDGNDNMNQVPLNLNSQDIARIEQYFMDTNGMKIWLTGDVSEVPVFFKVAFTVNVDAIAEVKD